MPATQVQRAALHGHWLNADTLKEFLLVRLPSGSGRSSDVELFSSMIRMKIWYALVYVVIEGFIELRLTDATVERLLADTTKVDLLRRFRNAIFHFQPSPWDQRLQGFLEEPGSARWVHDVHAAFKSYFEANPYA